MFFDLLSRLRKMPKRVRKTHLTPTEITGMIRRAVKMPGIVIIRTHRSQIVMDNQILVSGVYDREFDYQGLPYVELTISYCPTQRFLEVHFIDWNRLAFDIAECIGHEHVHKSFRNKKVIPYKSNATDENIREDQEYLGSNEEIAAYGYSIAADIVVNYDNNIDRMKEAEMYMIYASTFDNDQSVMLELENNIRKYFSNFKGGRNEQNRRQSSSRRRSRR